MQDGWYPIVDRDGRRGEVASCATDPSQLEVRFETGENLFVPRALVADGPEGAYLFGQSFASFFPRPSESDVVVPVIDEQIEIKKRVVERDRVRLTSTPTTRDEVVDVPLIKEDISVERVPIGQVVSAAIAPREEGDTLVIPVYEEVLVVEKRLVLKEEIRITRVRREVHETQHVELRRQEIQIERTGPDGAGH